MKYPLLCTALLIASFSLVAAEPGSTPLPEKGKVPAVKPVDFDGQLPEAKTHDEALARAAKEKRLVMTIFASSACPHCKAFREGVLGKDVFRAFAKDKLVIVVFDVTQLEAMTPAEQAVVASLEEKYNVEATPHIIVESPSHKILLTTQGYAGSEAAKVVADLTKLWTKEFGS
jgi:thioredoxin-related protein